MVNCKDKYFIEYLMNMIKYKKNKMKLFFCILFGVQMVWEFFDKYIMLYYMKN